MGTRRIGLLINPTSGGGRGGKNASVALRRMRERGLEVIELTGSSAQDSLVMAGDAVAKGIDGLVACGGDGTVHVALQAVAGTDTPLGIIPVGTGDDNARSLNIPRRDVAAAVDVIADGNLRTVDLGYATTADGTQRWFLGVLSAGFDSEVNELANNMTWPSGKLRYLRAILAELRVFKAIPYAMTVDNEEISLPGMLVAVGNGISYGGGMKVCPDAVLDDGLLDVTFLSEVSKFTFLRVFPSVFKGTHTTHPSVTQYRGKEITLDGPHQIAYADGERVGELPVQISVKPAALAVFTRSPVKLPVLSVGR